MYYSIGEISKMFDIPVSTLRYYDKEGLFPNLLRESGIRKFSAKEVETLRIIECLKKTGMEIKDIKEFIGWCSEGPATYEKRLNMFIKQKEHVEAEIVRMNKVLDMIRFKCWYYETAINDGNEERLHNLDSDRLPDEMPDEIKKAYKNSHE